MALPSLLPATAAPAGITAEALADRIRTEIARTCGSQLPCYRADEILNGFFARFGPEAGMMICDQAFSVHNGVWRGAPVTVRRFSGSQDPYFANPLLEEARADRQ